MRRWREGYLFRAAGFMLVGLLLGGCATPRIDWGSRVGTYTYDQSVLEFGPPDKYAKLSDGTLVAEWLLRRGYAYAYSPWVYSYSPWWYGPYYPVYYDVYAGSNQYLRLTFAPDGKLKAWKKFYR